MSRTEEDDKDKEIVRLRLALSFSDAKIEQLNATNKYLSIEAKSFEDKWLQSMDDSFGLRRELQATREDLDRVNEVLAKLFKNR